MFTGGVKFNTSRFCCELNTAVVVACHIYSWFLSMWWVLSLSILLSICRVYIYVRLIMSSCLLFCISFAMFGISHAVQMKRSSPCRVIVEVLVSGLLVVVYKILYSSCM